MVRTSYPYFQRIYLTTMFSNQVRIYPKWVIERKKTSHIVFTLKKYFLHPTLIIYSFFSFSFFSNPTYTTKTGTSNRWETTKRNPPYEPFRVISYLLKRQYKNLAKLSLFFPWRKLHIRSKLDYQNYQKFTNMKSLVRQVEGQRVLGVITWPPSH